MDGTPDGMSPPASSADPRSLIVPTRDVPFDTSRTAIPARPEVPFGVSPVVPAATAPITPAPVPVPAILPVEQYVVEPVIVPASAPAPVEPSPEPIFIPATPDIPSMPQPDLVALENASENVDIDQSIEAGRTIVVPGMPAAPMSPAPAPILPIAAPEPALTPPTPSTPVNIPVSMPVTIPVNIVPVAPKPEPVPAPAPVPIPTVAPVGPPPLSNSIPKVPEPATPVIKANPITNPYQSFSSSAAMMPAAVVSRPKRNFGALKKPILIIAIALVVLGGGAFALTKVFTGTPAAEQVTETPTKTQDTPAVQEQAPATTPAETTTAPATTETTTPTAPALTTPAAGTNTTTTTTTPAVANTAANTDVSQHPRTITIPKLNINASVETIGLTQAGAMGAPSNIWNAGWYNASATPGSNGAAFIDGHSSASRDGLFGYLDSLQSGDRIDVLRNDGKTISYMVVAVKTVNRNAVDMASMLKPYGAANKGLNIMSCIGKWIASENTLENRVLVYAVQI